MKAVQDDELSRGKAAEGGVKMWEIERPVQKRAHPVNRGFLNDIGLCLEDLL